MERPQLNATRRPQQGRRPAKQARLQGLVPGVVYGKSVEPISVAVNQRELTRMLNAREGEHGLVTLSIDGDGGSANAATWERPVLIKLLERDRVSGHIIHIDFHAIALTEHIRIKIPIVLQGDAIGVKQEGGIMEHFLREIEVDCLPTEIPKQVEFDISQLHVGQNVHVKDLVAPAGAKITSDLEGVIIAIQEPKVEKPEEVTEGAAEPEVIREKKPEAEAEGAAEGGKAEGGKKDKEEKAK